MDRTGQTTRPRPAQRGLTIRDVVGRAVDHAGGQAPLARQLNLKAGTSVLNYLRGIAVPQLDRLPALAAIAGLTLAEVQAAWWRDKQAQGRRQWWPGNEPPSPTSPAAAAPTGSTPPPDSPPPRRRRRSTALVIAGLSLTALAGAPGQRPITGAVQVREMTSEETSSVKSRTRRAA
jgi:hypothetical protein